MAINVENKVLYLIDSPGNLDSLAIILAFAIGYRAKADRFCSVPTFPLACGVKLRFNLGHIFQGVKRVLSRVAVLKNARLARSIQSLTLDTLSSIVLNRRVFTQHNPKETHHV